MELIGPNLTLRPPTPADAPALLALGGEERAVRWFSWGPYRSIAEPEAYVARAAEQRAAGTALDLLVVHHVDGPAGIIALNELSLRDRRAMVGTWLGSRWWGTAVNGEAKALVFHLAFAVLGLRRVGAYSDVANGRSARALEKVGMVREGVLRQWHCREDGWRDVAVFSLLAEEHGAELPVRLRGELPPAFAAYVG